MKNIILWNEIKENGIHKYSIEEELSYFGLNSGNLAFVRGIEEILLNGNEFKLPWHSSVEKIEKNINLFFPAANQLGGHTDMGNLAELWSKYDVPIVTLGLGIQSDINELPKINEGTKKWLDALVNNSEKFGTKLGVRGVKTERFINNLYPGKNIAVSIGCPSQFINSKKNILNSINRKIKSRMKRCAINSADISWKHIQHIEKRFINAIINEGYSYIVQAPPEEYAAARAPLNSNKVFYEKFSSIFFEKNEVSKSRNFFYNHSKSFVEIDEWINYLKPHDFNFGTRIHGTMLALAAGIPSLLIIVDSRTQELAEQLGIPHTSYFFETDPIDVIREKLISFDYEKMLEKWSSNARKIDNILKPLGIEYSNKFKEWLN